MALGTRNVRVEDEDGLVEPDKHSDKDGKRRVSANRSGVASQALRGPDDFFSKRKKLTFISTGGSNATSKLREWQPAANWKLPVGSHWFHAKRKNEFSYGHGRKVATPPKDRTF